MADREGKFTRREQRDQAAVQHYDGPVFVGEGGSKCVGRRIIDDVDLRFCRESEGFFYPVNGAMHLRHRRVGDMQSRRTDAAYEVREKLA